MIRDITIGQYYPAQSPIHKLDPRVKLFATLIYIIALFSYKGIAGVLFIVAALAAVIKISKVPFKFMVKGLKSIIILLLFTACFSVFFTQGEYTIWEYGILHISDTGLINAATMMIGLVFRYGCFGAVWSLVGMLLSLWTFNRMMAWIGPFIEIGRAHV